MQDALDWTDPHRENIWEEPSDADENALLISRGYIEGSVMWRIAQSEAAAVVVAK